MNCNITLLKNYVLYFLFLILISMVGISNIFAWKDYANPIELRDVTQQLVSTDYLNNPVDNPLNSAYAFDSVLQVDYIVSNYNFSANVNYQLESHLGQQQFTNVNAYSVQGLNGESCIISYSNSILNDDAYPRWAFQCPHATTTVTISIYNTNNSYLWSGTGIFNWQSAVLWTSPTPLESATSDADNIINNQNQNTQDIINNQNQNNQQQIESQKVCTEKIINKNDIVLDNSRLLSNGSIDNSLNNYGITNYIDIKNATDIYFLSVNNEYWANRSCFYNENKIFISCVDPISISSVNIPSNAYYMRISINKDTNKPQVKIKSCKNGNQALDDSLNDDDTSEASSEASDFFSNFNTNTFGLTSIVTAPLNLIQSITSSTCIDLHLPLPYLNNKYLDLPCMTTIYSNYFGSFFTIYQTITFGIVAYWICVRIFNLVKDFKNPEHDEIEVLDL